MATFTITVFLIFSLMVRALAHPFAKLKELRGFQDINPKRRTLTKDDFKGKYTRFMEISRTSMGRLCPRHILVSSNGLLLPNKSVDVLHNSLQFDDVPCTSSGSILFSHGRKLSSPLIQNVFGVSLNHTGRFGAVLHHILTEVQGFYLGIEKHIFTCGQNSFEPGTAILFSSDSEKFGRELSIPFHGLPIIILICDSKRSCAYSGPWLTPTHSPSPLKNTPHYPSTEGHTNNHHTPAGKPLKSTPGSGHGGMMQGGHSGTMSPPSTKAPYPLAHPVPSSSMMPSATPRQPYVTSTTVSPTTFMTNPKPTYEVQSTARPTQLSGGVTSTAKPTTTETSPTIYSKSPDGVTATTNAPLTGLMPTPSTTSSNVTIPTPAPAGGSTTTWTPNGATMTSYPMPIGSFVSTPTMDPSLIGGVSSTMAPTPSSPATTTTHPDSTVLASDIPKPTAVVTTASPHTTSDVLASAVPIPSTGGAMSTHPMPSSFTEGTGNPISTGGGTATASPSPIGIATMTFDPTSSLTTTSTPEQFLLPSVSVTATQTPGGGFAIVPRETGGLSSSFPEPSKAIYTVMPSPSSSRGAGQLGTDLGVTDILGENNGVESPSSSGVNSGAHNQTMNSNEKLSTPEASAENIFSETSPSPSAGSSVTQSDLSAVPASLLNSSDSPNSTTNSSKTPDFFSAFSSCFSADVMVILHTGKRVRMNQLMVGDLVHVGKGVFSPVIAFTHSDRHVTSVFIELVTKSGHKIFATPTHYLHSNRGLLSAGELLRNDELILADGTTSVIVERKQMYKDGLYNPHTADGNIDVNGILASTYTTTVKLRAAHSLFAPLRMLYVLDVGMLVAREISHAICVISDVSRWILS